MTLKLTNNVSKSETIIDDLIDIPVSNTYYKLSITLPSGMDEGEYTYELYDNNKKVANGLCQIGEYIPQHISYTATATTTYKVYNG